MLESFLKKLYDGFDVSSEIEPTAWREVLRLINEASVDGIIESGYTSHESAFLHNLRHSNEVFSAFKVHSMGSQMQARLLDKDGNLRSFSEWKDAVRPIANHQVGSWLQTEYDTAVLRAHQASDWQEFEHNRDIFPNLRWMPTTSPSPEDVHKGYWTSGLTLPIDDPFWTSNHPANRWNCKCSLEATSDPVSHDSYDGAPSTAQRGLEENPRHGHTFSDKHPYFPENCGACPYYKGKMKNVLGGLFVNRKKDCYSCPHIDFKIDIAKGATPPEVGSYEVEHRGKVLVSPHHGENELEENLRLAKLYSDLTGERVYLLPRIDPSDPNAKALRSKLLPPNVKEGKNPDFMIGGRLFEGKAMLDIAPGKSEDLYKGDIENRYKKAKKQSENVMIMIPEFVPQQAIDRAMKSQLGRSSTERVVAIVQGDKMLIYDNIGGVYKKRGG